MISHLKGELILRDDPYIILNVNGVGYKILASRSILETLTEKGKETSVFIYTHIREDILELYGFSTHQDLKLFELLISVSGIGPKTAIGAFSIGKTSDIIHALINNDVAFFMQIPRLGKKNAQKLIIELKNKVGSTTDLDLSETGQKESGELIKALKALGYNEGEARNAIREIGNKGDTLQKKVKLALKWLGK